MSTTTSRTGSSRGTSTGEQWIEDGRGTGESRLRSAGRRRSVPYLLVGVLLVLACAGGFVLLSLRSDDRRSVLVLGRDVTVGQVLTPQDLRQVDVAVDQGVAVVGLEQAAMVIGRPMATSLSAGSLLTPSSVGGAAIPVDGQAVAALALKPGAFPPQIAPGSPVAVVTIIGPNMSARTAAITSGTGGTATTGSAGGTTRPAEDNPPTTTGTTSWPAVVISVTSAPNDSTTVVSVELDADNARQVAAIPAGQLAIVMLPAGSLPAGSLPAGPSTAGPTTGGR